MENLTQSYEIVMVFTMANGDETAKALSARFLAMIEENATVDNVETWGKRRLAYPIQDQPDGYYLLVNFTSGKDFPAEVERVLNITDGVLRSMTVRHEPAKKVKVEPAKVKEVAVEAVAVEAVAEVAVEPVAEVAVEAVAEVAVEAVAEVAVEAVTEVAVEAVAEVAEEVTE